MEDKWRNRWQPSTSRIFPTLSTRSSRPGRDVSAGRVAQEVIHLLTQAVEETDTQSILELRGLGKELWKGIDAAAHVDAERRSWD